MKNPRSKRFMLSVAVAVLSCACTPTRDLDAAASGTGKSTLSSGGSSSGGVNAQAGIGGGKAAAGGSVLSLGGATAVDTSTTFTGGTSTVTGDTTEITAGATSSNGGAASSSGGGAAPSSSGTVTLMGGMTSSSAGAAPNSGGATNPSGGAMPNSGGMSAAAGGTAFSSGGVAPSSGGSTSGASAPISGGTHASAGGVGGATGGGGTILATGGSIAMDLPDLTNSPVQGAITYSAGASWDIDGVQWPAFEVHTPTANYWLVKSAAAIVSITDTSGLQWIGYSSGYRSLAGVPNLGGCCESGDPTKLGLPTMSTVLDQQATTSTHLRLVSKPVDGDYYWVVWDFFLTHVTVTVNRANAPFGFTYYGVPGGNLDSTDQLVLSTGVAQSAMNPAKQDLPGPAEWAYLSDPVQSVALFLIQHTDDALDETYSVASPQNSSARFVFGSGAITSTPVRFSLGLIDSADYSVVSERVAYIVESIPP
jgi:hypothetical protein